MKHNGFDYLLDRLYDACDYRLQNLQKTGRDGFGAEVWMKKHGIDSVDGMIHAMLSALKSIFECEGISVDQSIIDNIDVISIENDGYVMPVIRITAELEEPHVYKVWGSDYQSCDLPCWVSDRCFNALLKSNQDHLESLDYDNLEPKDGYDIYAGGNYDVRIEIDFKGEISYHPCDQIG